MLSYQKHIWTRKT